MLFLVEIDYVKSGTMPTTEGGRAFVEQIVLPTLERAEQFIAEKKILAGGPVAGRIALRFIVEVESSQDVDRIVYSMPLSIVSETRVTPLIAFADRRIHAQMLLEILTTKPSQKQA
jgi:hypothetical protein